MISFSGIRLGRSFVTHEGPTFSFKADLHFQLMWIGGYVIVPGYCSNISSLPSEEQKTKTKQKKGNFGSLFKNDDIKWNLW